MIPIAAIYSFWFSVDRENDGRSIVCKSAVRAKPPHKVRYFGSEFGEPMPLFHLRKSYGD